MRRSIYCHKKFSHVKLNISGANLLDEKYGTPGPCSQVLVESGSPIYIFSFFVFFILSLHTFCAKFIFFTAVEPICRNCGIYTPKLTYCRVSRCSGGWSFLAAFEEQWVGELIDNEVDAQIWHLENTCWLYNERWLREVLASGGYKKFRHQASIARKASENGVPAK